MSSKDSLFRAVLKERLRTALMVSGMASFLAGLLCMPIPLVNPSDDEPTRGFCSRRTRGSLRRRSLDFGRGALLHRGIRT